MQAREDLKWIQDLLNQKSVLASQLSAKEEKKRNSILEKRAAMHSKMTVDRDASNNKISNSGSAE